MADDKKQSPEAWPHGLARHRATVLKAVSFGLIGLVNTAVDIGLFSVAYYQIGLSILAANLMSWTFAVTSSYVLNSMFTFAAESKRKLSRKTYAKFVLAQLAGFAANTATVYIASYHMPVMFGKVLATGASFLVNFSLTHFVVFRRPTIATE